MFLLSKFDYTFRARGDVRVEQIKDKIFVRRRIILVDFYVCVWVFLDVILAAIALNYDLFTIKSQRAVFYVAISIASIRLLEIFQVSMNNILFDEITRKLRITASLERTVVLLFINYLEIIILFGVIYSLNKDKLSPAGAHSVDGFYLSAITHFTIGYGDLYPTDWLRIVASIHGFYVSIFVTWIFARVLGSFASMPIDGDGEST